MLRKGGEGRKCVAALWQVESKWGRGDRVITQRGRKGWGSKRKEGGEEGEREEDNNLMCH